MPRLRKQKQNESAAKSAGHSAVLQLQEMQAKNINSNNEMLHNLRILKQKVRFLANGRSEGERAGDKTQIDNKYMFFTSAASLILSYNRLS